MFTQLHQEALADTRQFDLGIDLLTRLRGVISFRERIELLEKAEEAFNQLEVREHAIRVAAAVRDLALHCGFDDLYANRLYNATRLHDIGKLFMPMHILEKDGRPTADEFAVIKEHARHGGDLLGENAPEFVTNVARYHHERYDGAGYNRIVGENIPLEARLVQIADVYDALRSKRAYKPGLSEEMTLERMVDMQGHNGGVMFDPYLFRRFVEMRLAADHDREIGAEATTRLATFAKTSPMTEIDASPDKTVFEGWEVSSKGWRKRKELDTEIDYEKVMEARNPVGELVFTSPDQKLRLNVSNAPSAANDDVPTPTDSRGPRF